MMTLLFVLQLTQSMERVTYDLEIVEGTRQVSAKLVLNQASPELFSIHCAKVGAGTLFTYWATPERDTLYLPRWNTAFEGQAHQPFPLFPKGPELTRDVWVKLLFAEPPPLGEGFMVADEAGWRILRNREAALTVRWRERKRSQDVQGAERALQVRLSQDTKVEVFAEIAQYWDEP